MIEFSVNSIRDYQICAFLYQCRHVEKQPETVYSRDLLSQRYENVLRRVVAFFFYKKQSGITPSYASVLSRWEKLWFPKEMTAYDLAVQSNAMTHGNYTTYSNLAAASLLQMHEDFSKTIGEPIMLEETYVVPIGKNMKLSGTFDLALRLKNDVHIIKWSTKAKRPPAASMAYDMAAMQYAFEQRGSLRDCNIKYHFYDFGSSHPGFVDVEYSSEDMNTLFYWAKDATETKHFVPRRGLTAFCKGCPFDDPCSKFTVTNQMLTEE